VPVTGLDSGRLALTSICPGRGAARGPCGDPAGDVLRVAAAPADQHGREGVLEGQATEEEAGGVVADAAVLRRPAVLAEHGQVHPAEDLLEADKKARAAGLDLIGIFHSHPDCDAYFSKTDLENSCPWYSFVVLSVKGGKFDHANSFLPNAEQTIAEKEELIWPKS